ncbi:MAG TPA: GntR family transcriptional regulator, partial [Firmicutes bacterium]|nr:GntR family transcriptional regulator [Bacillota bacterium]
KLELEGLVVMIPRKGAYVAGMSTKDIADVFEIRGALEGLAAELASERATDDDLERMERYLVKISEEIDTGDLSKVVETDTDFHTLIYEASRNARLSQIINNLREQIQRFRTTSLSYPGRMKKALEEHRKIVEAISSRDGELARKLAQEHIEMAENTMMGMIQHDTKLGGN